VKLDAAGYVLYGSSMMFVYCTGHGVHGFTLDPTVGEFLLSHENIRIPSKGSIFSMNLGNLTRWSPEMQKYVRHMQQEDPKTDRPYALRYVGSLVADVHRTMLYGGIYCYPGDSKNAQGKLRLMYENNPLAFIVENAGGAASNGRTRTLEVVPESLHQRSPLYIGSTQDVRLAEEFLAGTR
jgi:fructose-1,6-bisphosphatase I